MLNGKKKCTRKKRKKNWARLKERALSVHVVCVCWCELFLSPIYLFAKYNYSVSVHTVCTVNKEVEMAHV